MGKSTWWGGTDPEIMTKEVKDPLKTAVANPMSTYLSQEVGKGLPGYTGQMSEELDPKAYSRYQEFLSLNAGDWFDKAVGDPEMKRFKEEILPEVEEGWAGSLRGSGRYRDVEDTATQFSEGLAQQRAQAEVTIPQAQLAMAGGYKAMRDADYKLEYDDWFKSLPQLNPALTQAMNFLHDSVGTGTTVLSALDPGQKGWFSDLMGSVVSLAGAALL